MPTMWRSGRCRSGGEAYPAGNRCGGVGYPGVVDSSGPKCFRIAGDQLVPEEYQSIGTPHRDPRLFLGTDERRAEYELLKGKSRVFPGDTIVPAEDD